MRTIRHRSAALIAVLVLMGVSAAAAPSPAPSFAAATAGLRRQEGLAPIYVDQAGGRVLVALPTPDADGVAGRYIYQVYLRAGLGSSAVGLDRDQPGSTQIIVFRRVGRRVFAEYENDGFRADADGAAAQGAVTDSFAHSTTWSGDIAAVGPDGSLLVDLTSFLDRDAFGVADALKAAKQGSFKLDTSLSHPVLAAAMAFPENLEFEASETFTGDEPGAEVKSILPDPHSVTLTIHHSLIKLPAPGYRPRLSQPGVGVFDHLVADYAAPLNGPIVYRLAHRFRLEKTDPTAARSPVKRPIVFYVDPAAPAQVRDALIEGARWWAAAFEAAGFIDAFKVEALPAGVSPLDARYNVINWVHRQTRGWSYGQGIVDPRTGEIVKGSVLLGSQRIRQDRMIYEGLLGAAKTGTGGPNDPIQISLARLRQLSVHETGHALGLAHNFAGSTFDDRASVMDYPPPRVGIVGGALDFSNAYAVGVGSWDRFAIDWLYGETPPGADEAAALAAKLKDGYARGLRFVADPDARPMGAAHPDGALWDDGPDAVAGLAHALEVRRIALGRFGLASLPAGAPTADLRRIIVPIYLFHRYELAAAAKLVGGVRFTYGVGGDGHEATAPVPADRQRAALKALLATVDPGVLDLPEPVIALLSGANDGASDPAFDIEVFGDPMAPVFDLPAAADVAADLTFSELLAPERLNRVADLSARDQSMPGIGELLGQTTEAVFFTSGTVPRREAEIRRRIRIRLVLDLARAAGDKRLSPTVAAQVGDALKALGTRLRAAPGGDEADRALARSLSDTLLDPTHDPVAALGARDSAAAPKIPPGMPIGGEDCWFCETLAPAAR